VEDGPLTNFRATWNSFVQGQITTDVFTGHTIEGRSNLEVYQSGLRTCRNFLPLQSGPIATRPAFQAMGEFEGAVRLQEFLFNQDQIYLMIFKDQQVSIIRDDVVVRSNLTIPHTADQLASARFIYGGDSIIVLHPEVFPTLIQRTGSDTSWLVQNVAFSGGGGSNGGPVHDFGGGSENSWSATRGYPRCGCFHQNRMLLASTTWQPQTVWCSQSGAIYDFDPGTALDDEAITFTLSAGETNTIMDVTSFNNSLIMNTSLGEWTESSVPMTPTKVQFAATTSHGMIDTGIRTQKVDAAQLFVARDGNLRSMSYDIVQDQFVSTSLTTLVPNILSNPTSMTYCRNVAGSNLVTFRQSDGTLAILTINNDQKVQGWCVLQVGYGTEYADTMSIVDVAVLRTSINTLYALIAFNGTTYLGKWTQPGAAPLLDLYATDTSETATTTWTGFTQFANLDVTVVGNGVAFEGVHVDGDGGFILPSAVTEVTVGIPYTCLAETLPLAATVNGVLQRGNRARFIQADLSLRQTQSLFVQGRRVSFRLPGGLLDEPLRIENTAKRVKLSSQIGPEPTLQIEARDPFPAILISLSVDFTTRLPG
jgi:hypothetical protein